MIAMTTDVQVWLAKADRHAQRDERAGAAGARGLGRDPYAGDLYVFRGAKGAGEHSAFFAQRLGSQRVLILLKALVELRTAAERFRVRLS